MMQRAALIGGMWLLACGPAATPAAPAPEREAPAESAQPSSVEPPPPADVPPPADSTPPPAVEPQAAAPSIRDVCFAMCDKVKAKCPMSAFESCRVNCGKYESPSEGCEGVVRAALACARDATDLVCANVAPESCAKPFRQITACNSGQKPVEPTEPTTAALPVGFVLYDNAAERIHAPMPQGVAPSTGDVIAQVKHSDGGTYAIRKLPRPEGKLNEKRFLKLAMNMWGRCTDKMKMQGMVDKPGRTSINYTMKCPDGAEEQGLFWATDKVLYVASVRGGSSKSAADAFLYGFEVK